MTTKFLMTTLTAVLLTIVQVKAATDTLSVIRDVMTSMRQMDAYGYSYVVTNSYGGASAPVKASGTVCLDRSRRCLFEKGDYSTTVLNGEWYFKADHKGKTAVVVKLPSTRFAQEQKQVDRYLDGSTLFMQDSVIARYAKVLSYSQTATQISFKIRFLNTNEFNALTVVYDKGRKQLISLQVQTGVTVNGGRVYQDVVCNQFKIGVPKDIFSTLPFFEVLSEKVKLKQHTNYKIQSAL